MYDRLLQIDGLTRPDHTFLAEEDDCYYLGEYTARAGFAASPTNDLISNLKKKMSRQGQSDWRWKLWAIDKAGEELHRVLGQAGVEGATYVPVPPSKAIGDPEYDPRLVQILARMGQGFNLDARELVTQAASMPASHEGDRASIDELIANYRVNQAALTLQPRDGTLIIFDDMLTTGRHFKAIKRVLSLHFPQVRIIGLFIARRAPKAIDPTAILRSLNLSQDD